MKVPEKPKNLRDILEKNSWQVFKLLNDETVYDFVIKCNQDYIHWDKLRYKEIPNKINPEYIWALIKIFRSQQFKQIKFNDWIFKYLLLNDAQKKLHFMDKRTAGQLETALSVGGGCHDQKNRKRDITPKEKAQKLFRADDCQWL